MGENLQDHVSCFGCVTFLLNDTVSVVESRESRRLASVLDYWVAQDGPLTSPGGAEGIAFVNTVRNAQPDRPDMELSFGPGALTGDSSGSLRGLLGLDASVVNKVGVAVRNERRSSSVRTKIEILCNFVKLDSLLQTARYDKVT